MIINFVRNFPKRVSCLLVVDASGNKVAEARHFMFGEERHTSRTSLKDKTYNPVPRTGWATQ
ncbi:MAG: hypothetical protein CL609_02165 [Anaerolineaceae bacterium]|nr:hypothetical protein [Anaerolineaceae bacterium]